MSYLDIPRIHFAGSFFFDPGTLNNATMNYSNYDGSEPGQWFPDLDNTGWNPNGDMQAYFANCSVVSVLDSAGTLYSPSNSQDALIGARVDTQGPYGVISNFAGAPTSAGKFSDYDPDQQYRSQLNGTWIGVVIPASDPYDFANYAGFYGFLNPCNLRDLGLVWYDPRGNPAAGNYFSKIQVHAWIGNVAQSPLMSAFQTACGDTVGVRFTTDFFQGHKGVSGDDFGFGRVQGNFAPVADTELDQLAPRRRLGTFTNQANFKAEAKVMVRVPKSPPSQNRKTATPFATIISRASDDNPWKWYQDHYALYAMPAFAKVVELSTGSKILTLDLATALPQSRDASNGETRSVLTGFQLGYELGGSFVPLTNGTFNISADDYKKFSSMNKTIDYLEETGLFNIELAPGEADAIAAAPLTLKVDSGSGYELMRQEDFAGHYIDVDPPAIRLEQGQHQTVHLLWTQFGVPVANSDASSILPLYEYDVKWNLNTQMPAGENLLRYIWDITPGPDGGEAGDIAYQLGLTNTDGIAELVVTAPDQTMGLQGPRVGMLSRISYLLKENRSDSGSLPPGGRWQQPVDDYQEPSNGLEFFTALVWQKYTAPTHPTWDDDVKVLMPLLAQLYPGMASKLDIGDEETLLNNRQLFRKYLNKTLDDPSYMPVTRELSASRLEMLRNWLDTAPADEEVTS